jgi:hypothetical protein
VTLGKAKHARPYGESYEDRKLQYIRQGDNSMRHETKQAARVLDTIIGLIAKPAFGRVQGTCYVSKHPEHSFNSFGPIEAIAGKVLLVVDYNDQGDCMCLDPEKKYIVDIDHRDVNFLLKMEDINRALIENGGTPLL